MASTAPHLAATTLLDLSSVGPASRASRVLADYGAQVDSISACFSKGLGCPVGSVVAGSVEFTERAARLRKRFGGGMRQVGILAAAALHALDHHIGRLREDHAHAHYLATELARLPGIEIDLEATQTNIVYMDVAGSGHTAAAVAIWGGIAVLFRSRRLLQVWGAVFVLLVSLSRMYLGRHFLADVLGGMVEGLAMLSLALLLARGLGVLEPPLARTKGRSVISISGFDEYLSPNHLILGDGIPRDANLADVL